MLENFFNWLESMKTNMDFHMATVGSFAIDQYCILTENADIIFLLIFFGILGITCTADCLRFNKDLEKITLKKI
jgi:hypothetical protein